MMDANDRSFDKLLSDARRLTAEITGNLPKAIHATDLGVPSKIPFKAVSLREALIHRLADLSDIACKLYEQNRIVPAIIMVRAVMETLAMLYLLYVKVDRVVTSRELGEIDDFLMRGIFGWRNETLAAQPLNILKAVDELDRKFKGYRRLYDDLSEFVHPNWSGTSGAYGNLIKDKYKVELGAECSTLPPETGLPNLLASLVCFKYYYNALSKILPSFVDVCHADAQQRSS
jgi:hypothetical protein